MLRHAVAVVAATLAFLTACHKSSDDAQPAPAPGFAVEPSADGYLMRLDASALDGRRFLLSSAFADGKPVALSLANPSTVVRFIRKKDTLYLFEDVTQGQIATADLPVYNLLAQFPLISDPAFTDKHDLVIDFNTGILTYLASLFDVKDGSVVGSPVNADDDDDDTGGGSLSAPEFRSSYIERLDVNGDRLYVDQIVETSGSLNLAQVKYTLQQYEPRTDFPSRSGVEAEAKVGYFLNKPIFDANFVKREWINKWDIGKPITWYMSTNIPEDYKQAVRDGILYWNRALGSEVIAVADLPDGVTPNEPGYNVFQWLNSDAVDFAYADWRTDPLTGEILQAQIFMPDFVTVSRRDAGIVVRDQNHRRQRAPWLQARPERADAAGKHRQRCFAAAGRQMREGIARLLLEGASEDVIKRFAQDSVLAVVAHEVGHTLGLRHNFAAKNWATLSPSKLDEAVQAYLEHDTPPTKITTTSVMDYTDAISTALQGAQIRAGQPALSYDAAAIHWGYTTDDFRGLDLGGYCTDEQIDSYPDCRQFTATGDVIAGNFREWKQLKQHLLASLGLQFIYAKAPLDGSLPVPVDEVALDPVDAAEQRTAVLAYVSSMLRDAGENGASFLTAAKDLKFAGGVNRKDEEAAILAYQIKAVKAAGGIAKLFDLLIPQKRDDGSYMPAALATVETDWSDYINSDSFRSGQIKAAYEFSDDDRAYMTKVSSRYFAQFAEALLKEAIDILASTTDGKWAKVDHKTLGKKLKALASAIILAESQDEATGKVDDATVKVAKWYYPRELREAAVALLDSDLADAYPETFNAGAADAIVESLQAKLDAITTGESDALPTDLKALYLDTQAVKELLE